MAFERTQGIKPDSADRFIDQAVEILEALDDLREQEQRGDLRAKAALEEAAKDFLGTDLDPQEQFVLEVRAA